MIVAQKTSLIVFHMIIAFTVMYACTGSIAFGGIAAIIEPVCNAFLMPLHEKAWEKFKQKRQHPVIDTIPKMA